MAFCKCHAFLVIPFQPLDSSIERYDVVFVFVFVRRKLTISQYTDNKNYVCYIISGVVKISVALVLYRLDTRLWMHILLIADMIICATWTAVVTLIIGLGCTWHSPYQLSESVCQSTNYAQEISYVIFNVLHVVIPVFILWGVQIRGNLKWAVIALFSFGLL